MNIDRSTSLSATDMESLEEALAFVLKMYDDEFVNATAVSVQMERYMVLESDYVQTEQRVVWTASISGQTSVTKDVGSHDSSNGA